MRAGHGRCSADCWPARSRLKQLQPDGKGTVGKGLAINNMRAAIEIAGDQSDGNSLIGGPRSFRQNPGAVKANVDRGRNLMCGILKTVELDQHLLGDTAFGPDRREYVCHGLFLPVNYMGLASRAGSGFGTWAGVRHHCKPEKWTM